MKARDTFAIIICVGILVLPLIIPVVVAAEIDATTVVDWVIDGDTFDTTSGHRVRLADIDAPESGESGYHDAKDALISLVYGKKVYLDIDDIYETDQYGRLVCVVYVKSSSTYYTNVNKALLVEGVAVIKNYHNEFNPNTWTLHIHKDAIPEFPSFLILPLFMIATLTAVIIYAMRSHKKLEKNIK